MITRQTILRNRKGSSLLPAHGSGGVRATINPIAPQKNSAPKRGRLGRRGSGGGMPSRPSESPPHRPNTWRAEPSRNIFFSLIEKNSGGRAKEKIVKKTSLLDTRAKRAAAGRERTIWFRATTRVARGQSGFSSKKVRISSTK